MKTVTLEEYRPSPTLPRPSGTSSSNMHHSPPDPLDPLVVDDQTRRRPQQLRDLAIAVAAVLPGEFDDVGSQPLLVVTTMGRLALRRAMLSERRAGTTSETGSVLRTCKGNF